MSKLKSTYPRFLFKVPVIKKSGTVLWLQYFYKLSSNKYTVVTSKPVKDELLLLRREKKQVLRKSKNDIIEVLLNTKIAIENCPPRNLTSASILNYIIE